MPTAPNGPMVSWGQPGAEPEMRSTIRARAGLSRPLSEGFSILSGIGVTGSHR